MNMYSRSASSSAKTLKRTRLLKSYNHVYGTHIYVPLSLRSSFKTLGIIVISGYLPSANVLVKQHFLINSQFSLEI